MRATLVYGPGDVRVEEVPDPALREPTDAVVRVLGSGICEGDLVLARWTPTSEQGVPFGHEFLGIVEDIGSDVAGLSVGDLVVAPYIWSDNTCDFCAEGLHVSCRQAGRWGTSGVDGAQGEAVRVPYADGTLMPLSVDEDWGLLASVLTLSDVLPTAHHAAVKAGVGPRTSVTVIGDDAIGLLAVLAARRLGADRIVLMTGRAQRAGLAREFGATDVIAAHGDEAAAQARELAGGFGSHVVLECAGTRPALETAFEVVRDNGVISRAGVVQYAEGPIGRDMILRNITLTGGGASPRFYFEHLMPDILDGTIEPGRVFDRTLSLADVPDGYRAMAAGDALKVLVRP